MKYETYREYDPRGVALAEAALLSVWAGLGSYSQDLVLIGGLVPKYLCGQNQGGSGLPRPATLDVDIGIALAAGEGQYGNISWDLRGQGFLLVMSEGGGQRFAKNVEGFTIYVDLLAEHESYQEGTVTVGDAPASIAPGINRALAKARTVQVEGTDLQGARQSMPIRVCEVGPFLTLKLRAFCRRQQPKDAFDVLYTILHYDAGTDAAIGAFAEEVRIGNPACGDALCTLREHFKEESFPGPVKAAHFVLGAVTPGEPEDIQYRRRNIQQNMVSAAMRLLKAA